MTTFSARKKMLGLVVILSVGLLCGIKIVTSIAMTTYQERKAMPPWKVKKVGPKRLGVKAKEPDSAASPERVIEDQVPLHLPIKIEVSKFEVEPLLGNLEIKVTNTSNKPIYYLKLGIILPEILSSAGNPMGIPLRYGRMALIDFDEPVRTEDVPIRPGESHVFKIPESFLSKLSLRHSEIVTVHLFFQMINFGDKTGFSSTDGSPVPNTRNRKISSNYCREGKGGELVATSFVDSYLPRSYKTSHSFSPAFFVRVNVPVSTPLSQSNLCCPSSECSYAKPSKYTCHCGEADTFTIVGCNDPAGKCSDSYEIDRDCDDLPGVKRPEFFIQSCSAYCDRDNDGWYSVECGGADRNDNDPNITPFTPHARRHRLRRHQPHPRRLVSTLPPI